MKEQKGTKNVYMRRIFPPKIKGGECEAEAVTGIQNGKMAQTVNVRMGKIQGLAVSEG